MEHPTVSHMRIISAFSLSRKDADGEVISVCAYGHGMLRMLPLEHNDVNAEALYSCVALNRHNSFEFSLLLCCDYIQHELLVCLFSSKACKKRWNHGATILAFLHAPHFVIYWLVMTSYFLSLSRRFFLAHPPRTVAGAACFYCIFIFATNWFR